MWWCQQRYYCSCQKDAGLRGGCRGELCLPGGVLVSRAPCVRVCRSLCLTHVFWTHMKFMNACAIHSSGHTTSRTPPTPERKGPNKQTPSDMP